MEDRLTMSRPGKAALAALALILVITASWWALALWPMSAATPGWMARTRLVCFGAALDGLPNAGGWLLLVGQPLGMVLVLYAAWGREVREGLRAVLQRASGQVVVGVTLAGLVAGLGGVVVRVREASAQPFATSPAADLARQLTRVNDAPPAMALTDQAGRTVRLEQFRGRPVLVTFAYAHCETVCPLLVHDVLRARELAADVAPVTLVVTLDPWRDTPSRLPTIAEHWGLPSDAFVVGGDTALVAATLARWNVALQRDLRTGEIAHATLVYLVDREGRIAYAVSGNSGAAALAELARRL